MSDRLTVSLIDLCQPPPQDALLELDPYERQRAARFGADDRRRYEAAHCALRAAIRAFCGPSLRSLDFVRGPYGKPSVAHDPQCRFSLTYCGDFAMIALTRDTEIGVDLERERPIEAVEDIAACHFAAQEARALLARTPGAPRDRAFLRGWVRKEACVKAVGYGLFLPTNSFVSGIGPDPGPVVVALAGGEVELTVCSIAAPVGHVAAYATVRGPQYALR